MLEQLGKYRIDSVLGKGAMGTVYKAFDPHIARTVALKTIRKELFGDSHHEQLIGRFQNEAQAAGRLTHPNIVTVYDYGEDDGAAYIAMEFVDGTPLNTLLRSPEPRQPGQVMSWMRQLLGALQYAHSKGVVHRDVKPANLLITADDQVKVTDFGIARLDSSVLTQTGSMIGTPSYMSPEQFCGDLVDGRSDVFSAGIVLYQLLTGERPFSGSATMVMQQILNQTPVAPSSLNPTLDPQLDAVIARALAKRPDERYDSALSFLTALESSLHGQPLGVAELDDDRTRLLSPPPRDTTAGTGHLPTRTTTGTSTALETLTPWKQAIMPELESLLSHQIGPLARFLVKKTLAGADDFTATRTSLLSHIPSERGREQFISATDALYKRLNSSGASFDGTRPDATANRTATNTDAGRATTTHASLAQAGYDDNYARSAEGKLTLLIGPIAKIVVSRAMKHTREQSAFLQRLAEHIDDPAQRDRFLDEMRSVGGVS